MFYLEEPFSDDPVFTPLVFFSLAAWRAAASPEIGSALSDLARLGTGGGGGGGVLAAVLSLYWYLHRLLLLLLVRSSVIL